MFVIDDNADFLIAPIFDSVDVYAQVLLDVCIDIACKFAEASEEDEAVILGRILDSLLSENN